MINPYSSRCYPYVPMLLKKNEPSLQGFSGASLSLISFGEALMENAKISSEWLTGCCRSSMIGVTSVNVFLFLLWHIKLLPPFFLVPDNDDDKLCSSFIITLTGVVFVPLWENLTNCCLLLAYSQVYEEELCQPSCNSTGIVTWGAMLCCVASLCAPQ